MCGPDDPNLRNADRTGGLRDGQLEALETSYGQHLGTGDFAPAFGQVKGHTMADMLEVLGR